MQSPEDRPYAKASPLTTRLVLLLLSVLIPVALLMGAVVWWVTELDRAHAHRQALQLARTVTASVDSDIDGGIETLLALAGSPTLHSGQFEQFYQQMKEALSYRRLHGLLRGTDGQQLFNTRLPFGASLPKRDLLPAEQRAIATGLPHVTDLVVGGVTGTWLVGLIVPVAIDGQVRWLLTLSLDPNHFQRILAGIPLDADWIIALSDSTGRIIARSAEQEAYVGKQAHADVKAWSVPPEGAHRTPSMTGYDVVRGYKWSRKSDWMAAAFVSSSVIDAPLHRLWQLFGIGATAMIGSGLAGAYLIGRRIAAPIEQAAADAGRLGTGQPVRAHVSSLREANILSAALAKASDELGARTQALIEGEARFRGIFEQSAVGFEQVGLDGRLLGINDHLCRLLGYTREECLQKTFKTLTHAEHWESEDRLIASLLTGEKQHYEIEKRLITKSGAPIWVRVTSAIVRQADGRPMHRASVVEDITERRRERDAAARLAAIVQSFPDTLISTGLSGCIATWNPGAQEMFGFTEQEAVGQPLSILVPADRKEELELKLAAVSSGKTFKHDTVRLHKNGTLIDVASTAVPIYHNGVVTSMSVSMEDIRERKRREAEVTLLNRELAHRVKNTLAVIQSIANQTVRSTPNPDDFRTAFQGRLRALAAANDMLLQTNWQGSDLSDFVDRQLAPLVPHGSQQLVKSGPAFILPADQLIPLGLALHELGTNATKHGAWSAPGGQVDLSWRIDKQLEPCGRRRLVLRWAESGGPQVRASTRRGFGWTIIERGIPDATIDRRLERGGLVCEIAITLQD